jgi:N-acetyl-gamma-glutamyl-phosphate reductase
MRHNYASNINGPCTAAIVGARGYSGLELARLLLDHPQVKLTHCFATGDFQLAHDLMHVKASTVQCLKQDQLMSHLTDVVFLATPAEVSLELAPQIVAQGKMVIDLSGAFRLPPGPTAQWYGLTHTAQSAELLKATDYGLAPYCGPLSDAVKLIANPGCYATAVSMALIPLLKHDLVEVDSLVIDAKSGTTGAGRKAGESLLFSEVDGECLPYKVGKHQHLPEIQAAVQKYSGQAVDPHFVTHLLPLKRGITAAIFAKSKTRDRAAIERAFQAEYGDYPLARQGSNIAHMAKLSHVVGTPFVHFSFDLTGNKLYLFALLDNLLKGAASQAVENLNRVLDLPLNFALSGEV